MSSQDAISRIAVTHGVNGINVLDKLRSHKDLGQTPSGYKKEFFIKNWRAFGRNIVVVKFFSKFADRVEHPTYPDSEIHEYPVHPDNLHPHQGEAFCFLLMTIFSVYRHMPSNELWN